MSHWRIVGLLALTGCLAPKVAALQAELDRANVRMALLEARVAGLEEEAGRRVTPARGQGMASESRTVQAMSSSSSQGAANVTKGSGSPTIAP